MTYYFLLDGDSDTNILGEESFGVFYPSVGFHMLQRIINQKPELLESVEILDNHKKSYTITNFLDKLEKWKIKS